MNSDLPSTDHTNAVSERHQGTVPLVAPATFATPARRGFSWQRLGGRFLVISVLAHLLFGAGAAYLVVQTIQAKRKLTFQSGPKGPTASTRALEHQVQVKKQKSALSAPPQARRVTTTGLAKVALPDMPAMPSMSAALSPGAISGMGAAGLAPGAVGGGAGGMGGSGGAINFFGARTGGAGLPGNFYDLKQTTTRQTTNMTPAMYGTIITDFVRGGFNQGVLNRFFKSDKPIYTTQIWVPNIPAEQGPSAFNLQGIVKPSLWCVHYKGRVTAPESFTFHFVGAGDDLMLVRFDGKLVLDRCWYIDVPGWKESANYDYGFSDIRKGFAKGDAIKVEAGQSYPIEVLIGEQPGGEMFATLLQEVEGAEYNKDAKGNPVLPVFRMSSARPASNSPGKTFPPHRDDGPVWKTEPVLTNAASSISNR